MYVSVGCTLYPAYTRKKKKEAYSNTSICFLIQRVLLKCGLSQVNVSDQSDNIPACMHFFKGHVCAFILSVVTDSVLHKTVPGMQQRNDNGCLVLCNVA